MLRVLVAVLVLANLAFWAWSAGALESLGLAPARERDPTRAAQQVRPEAVRVLPSDVALSALDAASAASGAAVASAPTRPVFVCLEAGPFTAAGLEAAERALAAAALPEGSWLRTSHDVAAQYAVVLGPYADRDAMKARSDELGRLKLTFEALELPAEGGTGMPQPGLALGRYGNRSAADEALATFSQRGLRTARVVVLQPARSESRLRFENATPVLAEQLRALSGAALGAGFSPCAAPPAAR